MPWHPSWFSTCHFTLAIVATSWKYISLHSPSYHIINNYKLHLESLSSKNEKQTTSSPGKKNKKTRWALTFPCRPSTHLPQHRHLPGSSPSVRVKFGGHVFAPPTVYHVTHGETASFLLTSADGCEQMMADLSPNSKVFQWSFEKKVVWTIHHISISEYVWMTWDVHT